MQSNSADVLILGGGVIGLACAHALLAEGRSVHVLEQGRVGCGSSHGNCGTLTPSHAPPLAAPGMIGIALRWMMQPDAPLYVNPRMQPALLGWLMRFALRCNRRDWRATAQSRAALLNYSRAAIETLVRGAGLECEFEASGMNIVYRDAHRFDAALGEIAALRAIGVDVDAVDAAQLARDEPALRAGMAGALRFPGDAMLRPDRYVDELARIVRAAGGTIEEDCRVLGFERDADRIGVVCTSRGARQGAQVLLATGAWSPELGRQLGVRLPIQPGKGYSITFSRPELAPRGPLTLKERQVCVTAWGSGFRLGSTMEFSGYDTSLNRTRLDALVRGATEYLRMPVGPERVEEWYGWRPMTYDDLPILGCAPRVGNLWLATGHGMLGVSMSAGTGRLLADLIVGRAPAIDTAPYAVHRFAGNGT